MNGRHTEECQQASAKRAGYVGPNLERGEEIANMTPTVCTCRAGLDEDLLAPGQGATIVLYTDRLAATIAEVKGTKIGVKRDQQERTDKNGPYAESGGQEWSCKPNPDAEIEWYSIRKSGRIVAVGFPDARGEVTLRLGGRNPYRDPCF